MTRRVITFVCFIIVSGAWAMASTQFARIAQWQWYTLGGLTLFCAIIFYRWLRGGRTTRFSIFCVGLAMALMLLVTL